MAILAFFALLTIIAVVGVEAQPIGNETLGIAGGPTEPSSHGAYGTAINFLSLENPIVFSIEQDGWTSPDGLGFAFYTIGIRVDDGTIYRVTESNRLDRTLQQMGSYNFSRWVVTNYHVTDFYNVTFSSLSAGEHQVTVYLGNGGGGDLYVYIYASSIFTVHVPPVITILSPTGFITYENSSIPLILNTNENATWIGYSLDSQANQTIYGNTTLTDLTEGNHSIVVYANDTFGNMGKSDTAYFTVSLPAPTLSPTPTPTTTAATSPSVPEFPTTYALILIAVASGLVLAFKKRRH